MASTPPAEEGNTPQVTESNGVQQVQLTPEQAQQFKDEAQPKPDRPEGLPEGFDSWEAFGKAQLEAQQKAQQEAEANALTDEQKAQAEETLKEFPEEFRAKAQPFVEETLRTGTLSDEGVTKAAKEFGVSETIVRQWLAGAQAEAGSSVVAPVMEAIGGEEVYTEFSKWAEANYTADQKAAFNEGLNTDLAKTVTEAVKAWKESGNGPAPRDITRGERSGGTTAATGPQPYASMQEMTRDMNNPLYAKDPAFRAKVEARAAVSEFGNARTL